MREIPFTHQLETTDEQFLAHLNLPALARNETDAKRVVAHHFRSRKSLGWSFYSHGSPWHQTDAVGSVIEKADALLENRFRNSWPPHQWIELGSPNSADVDWGKGIAAAPTSISRGTWLCELSTGFALTGRT